MWNKIVCEFHHMNLRAKETEECQIQIELVSCLFVYFQVTSPMQWRFSIQTTSTNGTKGWMATPTRMTFRRSSKRPLTSPLIFGKSCCKFVSSVRSSNSHPDLLLTHQHQHQHPPTFSDHIGPQHWTFTF